MPFYKNKYNTTFYEVNIGSIWRYAIDKSNTFSAIEYKYNPKTLNGIKSRSVKTTSQEAIAFLRKYDRTYNG